MKKKPYLATGGGKKMKKKFVVFAILALILFLCLFELGKNTLWGWAVLLALFVFAFVLHKKVFAAKKFPLRLLAFVGFLLLVCVLFRFSGPPSKQVPAVSVKNPAATDVVRVEQGELTGVFNEDKSVEVYAGIPFAAPPVGDLRWKEPQPPASWDGVRVCDTFAPRSMQPDSSVIMTTLTQMVGFHNFSISLKDNFVEAMSEDSLYLNVWKPAGEWKDCPVLFFIHGGSLTTGNTSYSEYNGESLAKRGIIVVNCAYRLNVFGYYANELLQEESPNGTTGNYGLLDQIAALQWVHDNIASFGGDPDQITIAGESAGSSSVNAVCVSPLAKGLFRYAIAESSGITPVRPYHTFRSLQSALKSGKALQEEFGADDLEALRAIPAEKLVLTKQNNSAMTVDGYAIAEQPYLTYEKGENNEQALLNGFNVHEADYFTFLQKVTSENYEESLKEVLGDKAKEAAALYPPEPVDPAYKLAIVEMGGDAKGAFNKVYSAAWFSYSHYNWSRLLAANGTPVWLYYFTKDNGSLGSAHAGEMPYAYGNLDAHKTKYDESDYALSEHMMDCWVNFVRYGDPNGLQAELTDKAYPQWSKFNDTPTMVYEFGEHVGMVADPDLKLHQLIDSYQETLK